MVIKSIATMAWITAFQFCFVFLELFVSCFANGLCTIMIGHKIRNVGVSIHFYLNINTG